MAGRAPRQPTIKAPPVVASEPAPAAPVRSWTFHDLYRDVLKAHEQRRLWAERADADRRLLHAGVRLKEWAVSMNFWRDGRGNLLSAEHEFVSVASAFYGATDDEMVAVLWPRECTTEPKLKKALARLRKMRETLHERRIVVRYECSGCDACIPGPPVEPKRDVVAVVGGREYSRDEWDFPAGRPKPGV